MAAAEWAALEAEVESVQVRDAEPASAPAVVPAQAYRERSSLQRTECKRETRVEVVSR